MNSPLFRIQTKTLSNFICFIERAPSTEHLPVLPLSLFLSRSANCIWFSRKLDSDCSRHDPVFGRWFGSPIDWCIWGEEKQFHFRLVPFHHMLFAIPFYCWTWQGCALLFCLYCHSRMNYPSVCGIPRPETRRRSVYFSHWPPSPLPYSCSLFFLFFKREKPHLGENVKRRFNHWLKSFGRYFIQI